MDEEEYKLEMQVITMFLDVPFFLEKMWDSGAFLDGLTSASLALVVKDLLFRWSSWGLAQTFGRTFNSWIPASVERFSVGIISLSLASEIYSRLNYSQPGTAPFLIGSAAIGSAIFLDQVSSWHSICTDEAESLEKKGLRVTEGGVTWLSALPAAAMALAGVSYGVMSQAGPQLSGNLSAIVDWIYWPLGQSSLAWFVLVFCHLRFAYQILTLPSAIHRLIHWAKTGNMLFHHSQ